MKSGTSHLKDNKKQLLLTKLLSVDLKYISQ